MAQPSRCPPADSSSPAWPSQRRSRLAGVGCGSGSSGRLGLNSYRVRGGEETGFHVTSGPTDQRSPTALDVGDPHAPAENRQLLNAGFREAAIVHTGSLHGQGVSTVIELGSGADAQRELAVQLNQAAAAMRAHGGTVRRFRISSIPGSVGLDGGPADNVLFREGRCVLIVGDETSVTDHRAPAVHAARAIYTRTHRRTGACTP